MLGKCTFLRLIFDKASSSWCDRDVGSRFNLLLPLVVVDDDEDDGGTGSPL
jgi:hypothetical protein